MPIGDNKEFAIPKMSDGDVTVYVYAPGLTSVDDTATAKYMNTSMSRTQFCLRSDQAIQIVQIGGRVLTDPMTCPANGSITEREAGFRNDPAFDKIVLRPLADSTNVKLRVRGGLM